MAKYKYNPFTGTIDLIGGSGGGPGGGVFAADIPVVLSGGKNLGRFTTGQTIPSAGLTAEQVVTLLATEYQTPVFTSFSISGQANPLEVGDALTGLKAFTWSTSNNGNIKPNTIEITNITGATTLGTGLANDGSESLNIGTISNTSPISQQFRIELENTLDVTTTRNYTITSIYPYFYGTVASGGAAPGVGRPAANQALIDTGTKVLLSSSGTITVPFNSLSDDYIWFAVPSSSPTKTSWYETALNNGAIGGSVSVAGNLFPDFDFLSVTTVKWAGVSYEVYISNFQTTANTLQLRN